MADAIELWLLDRAKLQEFLAKIELDQGLLSTDEIERAKAMTDRLAAIRWQCGQTALRMLIRTRLGMAIAAVPMLRTAGGRPLLPDPAFDFSLSHCGPHLLIGLSRTGRIGVDIEIDRNLRMTASRLERLVAAATGLTLSEERSATPVQAWTRIEAFAKATAPNVGAALEALGLATRDIKKIAVDVLPAYARTELERSAAVVQDLQLASGLVGALACPRDVWIAAAPPVHDLDQDTICGMMT